MFLPNTLGTDLASSTTSFLATKGLIEVSALIGGVILGAYILERVVGVVARRNNPTQINDQN